MLLELEVLYMNKDIVDNEKMLDNVIKKLSVEEAYQRMKF